MRIDEAGDDHFACNVDFDGAAVIAHRSHDAIARDGDVAGEWLGRGAVIDGAAGDQHVGLLSLPRRRAGQNRAQRR